MKKSEIILGILALIQGVILFATLLLLDEVKVDRDIWVTQAETCWNQTLKKEIKK